MTAIEWDVLEERFFDQGVDHGVIYDQVAGAYIDGVAWNGLVTVTRSPSGAEPNKQYADNIVYVNLLSAEEFAATIECFMAPEKFDKYNGIDKSVNGLKVTGQSRGLFGFSWRTGKGTAGDPDAGYELHFAYGCQASPSEMANTTKNDSPEPVTASFALSTTPVSVPGKKPTAYTSVSSLDPDVSAANLAALEAILYGDEVNAPRLPLPAEMETILGTGILTDTPAQPAFDDVDTITIPADPGTDYYVDGVLVADGALVITEDTVVVARPAPGYTFTGVFVDRWLYEVA